VCVCVIDLIILNCLYANALSGLDSKTQSVHCLAVGDMSRLHDVGSFARGGYSRE